MNWIGFTFQSGDYKFEVDGKYEYRAGTTYKCVSDDQELFLSESKLKEHWKAQLKEHLQQIQEILIIDKIYYAYEDDFDNLFYNRFEDLK